MGIVLMRSMRNGADFMVAFMLEGYAPMLFLDGWTPGIQDSRTPERRSIKGLRTSVAAIPVASALKPSKVTRRLGCSDSGHPCGRKHFVEDYVKAKGQCLRPTAGLPCQFMLLSWINTLGTLAP